MPQPFVHEQPGAEWQKCVVRITVWGWRVLLGRSNWLDYTPAERWVGEGNRCRSKAVGGEWSRASVASFLSSAG